MNNKIRVLFDTNVLVYAHDESATHHRDSAELLALAIENRIRGVLAGQNIIELYRILTNSAAMKGTPLSPLQANNLITASEAITLFYQQVSLQKDLTFLVNIPNEITETTFNKTDNQEELVICENAEDMFNKLGI